MMAAEVRAALACSRSFCDCHRATGHNTHCVGPNHANGDRRPSLTIHDAADGKLLVNCKAGCDSSAIIRTLKERNLWPDPAERPRLTVVRKEPEPQASSYKLVATYEYKDAAGTVVAIKERFETRDGAKRFAWKRPDGDGTVVMADTPLYGADLVAAADPTQPIVYVEGEKAALACREKGLLAVTFGGGASTTDFGNALAVLAGRTVLLWPDNDSVGRRYMARVEAALRPITKLVRLIQVPYTNEHDDAVEFFQQGGTVQSVLDLAPIATASLEWLTDDAVIIRQPCAAGTIAFKFSEIEYSAKSIEAEIDVSLSGPGLDGATVSQRINVMSGSAVTDLRRLLEGTYADANLGKNFWLLPLNQAIASLRKALATHDPSKLVGDIEPPGPIRYLVDGIIPAKVPVLIFGKGSAAKGWLALRMALGMAVSGDFLGRRCQPASVLYLDYEDVEESFRRRIDRLAMGMDLSPDAISSAPIHYRNANGTPLVNLVAGLKQKIARDNIEVIIIDSVVAACGGKPEEAETAMRYFNALSKLGIASISIAHIAKNGDGSDPFGSIFFTNFPRRTMLVTRTGEGSSFTLGVIPKKVNDVGMMASFGMAVEFDDPDGPVVTKYADARDEPELVAKMGMREQLIAALRAHAKTIAELVDEIGAPEQTIRNTLYRYRDTDFENLNPGRGKGATSLWGLCLRSNAS